MTGVPPPVDAVDTIEGDFDPDWWITHGVRTYNLNRERLEELRDGGGVGAVVARVRAEPNRYYNNE